MLVTHICEGDCSGDTCELGYSGKQRYGIHCSSMSVLETPQPLRACIDVVRQNIGIEHCIDCAHCTCFSCICIHACPTTEGTFAREKHRGGWGAQAGVECGTFAPCSLDAFLKMIESMLSLSHCSFDPPEVTCPVILAQLHTSPEFFSPER